MPLGHLALSLRESLWAPHSELLTCPMCPLPSYYPPPPTEKTFIENLSLLNCIFT